jgi:alanyl aminopeptidase
MADTFCDGEKLGELHRLFDEYGDLVPGYQRSLSQTEERIGLCIALRDRGKKLADAINDL